MKRSLFSVLVVLGLFFVAVAPAAALIVDFDSIAAPGFYTGVTPGGPQGPVLNFTGLSFDGGVVMNESGWNGLATTNPNLYGTSDFLPLADNSLLPGVIKGTFTMNTSDILSMSVINGFIASTFTLNAYNAANALIGTTSTNLSAYPGSGAVGSLALVSPGIKSFEVVSAQGSGHIDFAIDTVGYCLCPAPIPGTLFLLGSGIIGLLGWRQRKV